MKRAMLFFIVVLLGVLPAMTAFAAEPQPGVATIRANANLRAGPSTETESVLVLPKGSKVTVVGVEGEWYQVRYGNYAGYVRADLFEGGGAEAVPNPTEKPPGISGGATMPVLKLGMRGAEVRNLQDSLDALGYNAGKADGIFGQATLLAVIQFQKDNGILADGVVGKETYDAVELLLKKGGSVPRPTAGTPSPGTPAPGFPPAAATVPPVTFTRTLKSGMTGNDVHLFNQRLLALGYVSYAGNSYNAAAVKAFQQRNALVADGIAGPYTQAALFSPSAVAAANAAQPTVTPAPLYPMATPYNPTVSINRVLRPGMTGSDVLSVNERLKQLGYVSVATDAYNESAVSAFQARNGLPIDGVVGTATLNALFSAFAAAIPYPTQPASSPPPASTAVAFSRVLSPGMTGSDVLALNERLQALGYLSAATATYNEDAVRLFQTLNNLTIDGIAGASTLNRILSSSAVALRSSPAATQAPPPAPTGVSFTRTLKAGMTGTDVLALNERLAALHYLTNPTNLYNAAAVRAFQQRNGLVVDAIAGPATVSRLFSTVAVSAAVPAPTQTSGAGSLQYGSKGETVRALQRALQQLGYYTEGVDGDFGAATRMAVSLFQRSHNLSDTGVADAQTQALLYGGSAQPAPAPTPFAPAYPGAGALDSPPSASQVQFANWDREIKPNYAAGQVVTVYDYNAKLAWQLRFYALGDHADSEPLTAKDTEVMFRAFGLKNTWSPRPVWVIMPGGRVYMASIHNMPHLTSSIKDNNFDGHLCLHFPRDMSAAQAVGSYAVTHQNCILSGWQATQGRR